MKRIRAYEKLIKDIQKELEKLKTDIDAIPDLNLINIAFSFLEPNFLNPSHIQDLYSRLDKLKAKAQNGLDYYEIGAIKENLKLKADQEVSNTNQEANTSQETTFHQEKDSIEEDYYSQLIDLLADINYLEKRLHQKDNNL